MHTISSCHRAHFTGHSGFTLAALTLGALIGACSDDGGSDGDAASSPALESASKPCGPWPARRPDNRYLMNNR
jgi:hypothetical protein